jgi:hypothetical protein
VFNLSEAEKPFTVSFPAEYKSIDTGQISKVFKIGPADGDIFMKPLALKVQNQGL